DPAAAFLWRRVCRDLDGELRIGVVARDEAVTGRTIRALSAIERVEWVPMRLESAGDTLRPTLGAIDRLLSVHVLVWATPAAAALGAEERDGMDALVDVGAPARRSVVITDTELLERMSDDPGAELLDVHERARALCDGSWDVTSLAETHRWIEALRA